jgi:hypothetical protein
MSRISHSALFINWWFVDAKQLEINCAEIEFFPGESVTILLKDSVLQYDRMQHRNICQWNTKHAVYLVRRQIQHWASKGFPAAVPGLEGELQTAFEKAKLCEDILATHGDIAKELSRSDLTGTTAAIKAEMRNFQVLWD